MQGWVYYIDNRSFSEICSNVFVCLSDKRKMRTLCSKEANFRFHFKWRKHRFSDIARYLSSEVASRFSGGMFANVRVLRCAILAIPLNIHFLQELHDLFHYSMTWQSGRQQNKSIDASSIIEYSHGVQLNLFCVRIDYVEQFQSSLNTYLPCLKKLYVQYQYLLSVTNNFTGNSTRVSSVEMKRIMFDQVMYLVQSRDFYL